MFVLPAVEPFSGGAVGGVILGGVDPAVNDGEFFLGDVGVVSKDVFADAVGYTDYALAAGHDLGVGVDGIETVHRGYEARSLGWIKFTPCKISNPCGHSRSHMDYVRALLSKQFP